MARVLLWLKVTLLGCSLWSASAQAAQIAVDLADGSVLIETDSDAPRRPASLVKLMTAYVAFEALTAGEIGDDTAVTISAHAAKQPPVKLGLRAGKESTFETVLGAAVVGSKNDAAVAVAESVAGSEPTFVQRMNETAARLGLANTRFVNATGLPAAGQQTSARDIAILARALLTDFPERSKLFSRRSVSAVGRTVSTTNPLFGRVVGAEGMKTGFTCAAGYSIAALVERDGRRVLAISLGHVSKGTRLSAVRGLISAAFKVPATGAALSQGAPSTKAPRDVGACAGAPAPVIATDLPPEEYALYQAELAKARARVARTAVPKPVPQVAAPPPLFGWGVFLGAFSDERKARVRLSNVRRRIGARANPRLETRRRDGRARAGLYGLDQRLAPATCRSIDSYCIVLTPTKLLNPKAQWRR